MSDNFSADGPIDKKAGVENVRVNIEVKEEDWNYKTSEHVSKMATKASVTTDTEGNASWKYAFPQGGSFRIIMTGKDKKGHEFTSTEYVWIADAQYGIYYDDNKPGTEQIFIQTEKEKMKSGETATIKIFAPQQEGALQVTIYNSAAQQIAAYKLTEGRYEMPLKITPEMSPGIYILRNHSTATAFSPKNSSKSPRKSHGDRHRHSKEYGPRGKVTLDVTTKDEDGKPVPAEVSVSVIDKALLALKQFEKWVTIHDAFIPNRAKSFCEIQYRRLCDRFSRKGGCFLAGTRILMADGSTKVIEDIESAT